MSTPTTGTSSRSSSWPRAGRAGGPDPRAARRPGHAAQLRARRSCATSRRGWRSSTRTPGSPPSAAATTPWTATSAGSGSSAATTRSSMRQGCTPRPRRRRSRRPTRAARPTSSSSHRRSTAPTAPLRDGDAIVHVNFRADRARQLTHALADAGFDGFDRAARRPAGAARACSS